MHLLNIKVTLRVCIVTYFRRLFNRILKKEEGGDSFIIAFFRLDYQLQYLFDILFSEVKGGIVDQNTRYAHNAVFLP